MTNINLKEDNTNTLNVNLEQRKVIQTFNRILKNTFISITNLMKYIENNSKYHHLLLVSLSYGKSSYSNNNIDEFISFIKASEEIDTEEIMQQRTQTEMFQKKLKELLSVKDFIKENYNQLLPQDLQYSNNTLNDKDKNKEKDKPQELIRPNDNPIDDDDIGIESLSSPKLLGKKTNRPPDNSSSSLCDQDQSKKHLMKTCYICKTLFIKGNVHHTQAYLCKQCGDLNQSFKTIHIDLTGRIAVVTGGRVKIGYEIVKKLLEFNCKVIVTSRFPMDTLMKYQREHEYNKWKGNLIIYPIDFRFFPSTNKFIDYLNQNYSHIDILINNAAQTIRRTSTYYKYLLPIESNSNNDNNKDINKIVKCDYVNPSLQLRDNSAEDKDKDNDLTISSLMQFNPQSQSPSVPFSVYSSQFKIIKEKDQPTTAMLGSDGQPYDFSNGINSWNMQIDEVPFEEFMEVQLINVWTPYYLNIKLKPLLMQSPFTDKYIVNVTSVEGMFNRPKTTKHPHTNMAKAALNMMTRTVGDYYKKSGIYMTSVDTGWVSEMNEVNRLVKDKDDKFQFTYLNIPLDELDGAIRVLHPIIDGVIGKKYYSGILLKDFYRADW